MYGIGIVRSVKIIRRKKIVELLYDSRKNEIISSQKRISLRFIFVICSLLSMLAGEFIIRKVLSIQTNAAWIYLVCSFVLLLLGIYGVYYNFPIIMITLAKRKKKIKYSKCNLFYLGQIGHRIQSCGRMITITAILFMLSVITMFTGLFMGAEHKAKIKIHYPYDVGVAIDASLTKNSFDDLISFVNEKFPIQKEIVYYLHDVEGYPILSLALSDYNDLRSMLELEKVELATNEYLVHCDIWTHIENIKIAMKNQPNIIIAGETLENPKERIYEEAMEQYKMAGSYGYVLVVPDKVAEKLTANKIRIVMKLENGGVPELRSEIRKYLNSEKWNPELQ